MPKEDLIEVVGVVVESLPNAMFRVELDHKHQISRARLRKNAKTLHPHPDWRSSARRVVTVRLNERPDHVPEHVAISVSGAVGCAYRYGR